MTNSLFWEIVGWSGTVLFTGRFVVQWLASERAGKSVVPPAFWYMSFPGAILQLAWAISANSPLGIIGKNINLYVFARNIGLIWKERGWLSGWRNTVYYIAAAAITLGALGFAIRGLMVEHDTISGLQDDQVAQAWLWLALGFAGQALYAARMIVQWLVSERAGRSVVPPAFWYMSAFAASMMGIHFIERGDWVLVVSMAVTLYIYLRNIWFIHRGQEVPPSE